MPGQFEIKKASNGQFYFVLKAANGEAILKSEMYKAKGSAEKGIASVKANAAKDANYEKKDAADGKAMFNLRAANKEIIGTSETYSSAAARDAGIASVKANAASATVKDSSA